MAETRKSGKIPDPSVAVIEPHETAWIRTIVWVVLCLADHGACPVRTVSHEFVVSHAAEDTGLMLVVSDSLGYLPH